MANPNNSASHWCKSVIENAIPTLKSGPTMPLPPGYAQSAGLSGGVSQQQQQQPWMTSALTAAGVTSTTPAATAATTTSSMSGVSGYSTPLAKMDPIYLQYYQQYYSFPTAFSSSATTASSSVTTAATTAPVNSYKAALMTPNLQATAANTLTSSAQSAGATTLWNTAAAYGSIGAGIGGGVNALTATLPKKPNPSRFTSTSSMPLSSSTSVTNANNANASVKSNQPAQQPASLREFVKRSFATCTSDAERDYVSKELQKIVSRVTAEGRLHVHKWELEPALAMPRSAPPPVRPVSLQIDTRPQEGTPNAQSSLTSPAGANDASASNRKRKSRFDDELPSNIPSVSTFSLIEKKDTSSAKRRLQGSSLDTPDDFQMRQRRAFRFQQEDEGGTEEEVSYHEKRSRLNNHSSSGSHNSHGEVGMDLDSLRVVGTCQKLEKDYFRLTSAPLPSAVRPESVLRKALEFILHRWESDEVDYLYMCSQLKSIRQDLTVQHIENVYETHARVALESDDLNEYNQCQTQLKQLYALGYRGCEMEFLAYRILYYVYLQDSVNSSAGSSDMIFLYRTLTTAARDDSAVHHALSLHRAVASGNYHVFFQLHRSTPHMGYCLVDLMIPSLRLKALQQMVKGFKPNVSALFVLQELGFDLHDEHDEKQQDYQSLLRLVISHTDAIKEEAEAKKKEQGKETENALEEKGKKKRKKKEKKQKKKGAEEQVQEQIGHSVSRAHHGDHSEAHQRLLQSHLFAGLQFLYKAGCQLVVENGELLWDTKTTVLRPLAEALGEIKLLL
eukprot:scaffold2229_cov176-Ochromonas_danica.AAC.6